MIDHFHARAYGKLSERVRSFVIARKHGQDTEAEAECLVRAYEEAMKDEAAYDAACREERDRVLRETEWVRRRA